MAKITPKDKSVVVYESRNQWMHNLLYKLGIVSLKESPIEPKDETPEETPPNNQINDIEFDDDETVDEYLTALDPKEWKKQDHYKVLGLSKRRIDSTESDIKKSYRKIVLRHHPDKRGQNVDLDFDYYSCITKANEILSDPVKRRSYDSVDPTFDDTIPNPTTYNKNRFFQVFGPVFKTNSIWSTDKSVPDLGDANSSYDEVNNFYNFWYSFDSWREYSYLDEEEKEKGENREERRYLDKQNKIARNQRKKEEMQRIRQLVDNAYQCDPRVAKFKEDEKKRKLEAKLAKQESIKAKKEKEERIEREKVEQELAIKKKQEDEERQKKEEDKRQKEALKKRTRKECKLVESLLQNHNYFSDDGPLKIENMKDADKLCKIYTLDQLISFRQSLESLKSEAEKKSFFISQIEQLNKNLENERIKLSNTNYSTNGTSSSVSAKKIWSYDDVQILIKSVKLFPAGTTNRWTVIANYINDKSESGITRNHRDALEKAKELQHTDSQSLKEEANKNAFKKLESQMVTKVDNSKELTPSQRYDAPSSILEVNDTPWTNEEQQLLEQAMKTYPARLGVERWDLIADCIPNRSRADCIKRYKHLVELVKAKNEAKKNAKK